MFTPKCHHNKHTFDSEGTVHRKQSTLVPFWILKTRCVPKRWSEHTHLFLHRKCSYAKAHWLPKMLLKQTLFVMCRKCSYTILLQVIGTILETQRLAATNRNVAKTTTLFMCRTVPTNAYCSKPLPIKGAKTSHMQEIFLHKHTPSSKCLLTMWLKEHKF